MTIDHSFDDRSALPTSPQCGDVLPNLSQGSYAALAGARRAREELQSNFSRAYGPIQRSFAPSSLLERILVETAGNGQREKSNAPSLSIAEAVGWKSSEGGPEVTGITRKKVIDRRNHQK